MLADTEQELARRIEQATASLATLTELQAALDLLEERHAQLAGAPTTSQDDKAEKDENADEATGEAASDEDAVIDLTDSADATAEHAAEHAAGEEPDGEPGADDQLDGSLRDAVARVTQYLSKGQEPEG